MACTTSIQNLIDYLQSLLESNQNACCQELVLPADVSTYNNDILMQCNVQTSSIVSPISSCVNRLHNFDIPIHTFCEYLFRRESTNLTPIQVSSLWKDCFQAPGAAPPRLDMLSSSNTEEYYLLKAWLSIFIKYIETALTINNTDRATVDMAYQTIQDNQRYLQDQLASLHIYQSHEDIMQDITDDPQSFNEVLQQEHKEHTRDQLGAKKCGKRAPRRKHHMHVPIHRAKMQHFDHSLVDSRFKQEEKEWERQLKDSRILEQNIEQKRILGKAIASVLIECKACLNRIQQLVQRFLDKWRQNALMCNITEMPLMCRMTLQQQLKAALFDVRSLMKQQRAQSNIALCENMCKSSRSYYPFFNYTTSSCSSYSSCISNVSISRVLDASNTLFAYTTSQLVLKEINNTKLQPDAVVTKNELKCIIAKLTQWKCSLILTSA